MDDFSSGPAPFASLLAGLFVRGVGISIAGAGILLAVAYTLR